MVITLRVILECQLNQQRNKNIQIKGVAVKFITKWVKRLPWLKKEKKRVTKHDAADILNHWHIGLPLWSGIMDLFLNYCTGSFFMQNNRNSLFLHCISYVLLLFCSFSWLSVTLKEMKSLNGCCNHTMGSTVLVCLLQCCILKLLKKYNL